MSPDGRLPSNVRAISANGEVIVGQVESKSGGQPVAFRWTAQTGMRDIRTGEAKSSRADSISVDGSAISGSVDGADGKTQGFRWTAARGLEKFGRNWSYVQTSGISDDGTILVGAFWYQDYDPHAFYWTERDGVQSIADDKFFQMSQLTDSGALGISGDGSTIVGWAADDQRQQAIAFRWTRANGAQYIGNVGGGDNIPHWMGVSKDGSVVVGTAFNGSYRGATEHVFRWTREEGFKNVIPDGESNALGMSSDGSKLFGEYRVEDQFHYFVWTKNSGVVDTGIVADRTQWPLISDRAITLVPAR